MADLSAVTDNYFPVAHESFADNLSSSILAGATSVPISNLSEYDDDDIVVLTVEPGTVNEATFVGVKKSTPYRVDEVIWTEGNLAVGHANGVTVIDYDSATHFNLVTKGIRQFANDDGSLKTQPVRDALALGSSAVNGWEVLPNTLSVSSGYNKGNKEFDLQAANVDVRTFLSVGMRLRLQRNTTAPTQCADLESSSSQYASRASGSVTGTISTMTDDITLEAIVKQESYGVMTILGRTDATPANGFRLAMASDGRIEAVGWNAGGSNFKQVITRQSLPLGQWTHIAVTMDMSSFTTATNKAYINGTEVPVQLNTSGTNPSAFVNTGDLAIGRSGAVVAGTYFDGMVSDVRAWNTIRTATQIKDNMWQQLTGGETNLVGYWKLNGDFNDSTSAANNLSASGGAVATTLDNPMRTTEYAIITKLAYSAPNSTITVFTGVEHTIPNMTLTAPYYSTQHVPFGFPGAATDWEVTSRIHTLETVAIGSINNFVAFSNKVTAPTGKWDLKLKGEFAQDSTVSGSRSAWVGLGTTTPAAIVSGQVDRTIPIWVRMVAQAATTAVTNGAEVSAPIVVDTPTEYKLYGAIDAATGSETISTRGDNAPVVMTVRSAYI